MIEARTAARPYAQAAFKLAQQKGQLAPWSEQLALMAAVAENDTVARMAFDPRLDRGQIVAAFEEICGDRLTPEGKNFIHLLVDNRRLSLLPEIRVLYEELRGAAEQRVEAVARSAFELKPEQQKKITEALKRKFGQTVDLKTEVDKSILGGVVIRVGDRVIDGSVRGRLQELSADLVN